MLRLKDTCELLGSAPELSPILWIVECGRVAKAVCRASRLERRLPQACISPPTIGWWPLRSWLLFLSGDACRRFKPRDPPEPFRKRHGCNLNSASDSAARFFIDFKCLRLAIWNVSARTPYGLRPSAVLRSITGLKVTFEISSMTLPESFSMISSE